jgi:hypothetical protein
MARWCDPKPHDARFVCVLHRARSFEPAGPAFLVVPDELTAMAFARPDWQWCWSIEHVPASSQRGAHGLPAL